MKLKPQLRFMQTEHAIVDAESRTVEFPFSSETPVDRYFGTEVLAHDAGAARMDRLNNGAPLLFNHNMDEVVGVVESARMDAKAKRGFATVRFAKTARADEVMSMVNDGVLRNVSFMYRIHEYEVQPKTDAMRVTDWEPMEVSIVSVPADNTVGLGRAFADEEFEARARENSPPAARAANTGVILMDAATQTPAAGANAETQVNATPQQFETQRVKAIEYFCKANKIDERSMRQWIADGTSVDVVGDQILKIVEERGRLAPATAIGLTRHETERFSMWRAIQAVSSGDWTKAGFELEASRAVADKIQRSAQKNSFFVPMEVQTRNYAKRDATVAGTGAYLVATENMSFVELLRNKMVIKQMGGTTLSGLVGNVTIPKQTAGATAYWLASESTQITEGNQTFGQLALSPKTVGAYTEISRLLRLQSSPDAEGLIMGDLAKQVAIAADLAGLAGSGSAGQPQGVIGTGSTGSVSMGTFDFADILNFQEDLATANALGGSLGYVTTPAVASLCIQRVKYSNTASPLWEGNLLEGTMVGFKAMSSNQVPSGDMVFGDWSQLVIAEWGVLEIAVNEQANFQAGIAGIRCFYTLDVGVRIPAAFSIGTSAS